MADAVVGTAVLELEGGKIITNAELMQSMDETDAALRDTLEDKPGSGHSPPAVYPEPEKGTKIDQSGYNPYHTSTAPAWELEKPGRCAGCSIL